MRQVVERVADHLGKVLNEGQMTRILEHLKFKQFVETEEATIQDIRQAGIMNEEGRFFRKGTLLFIHPHYEIGI